MTQILLKLTMKHAKIFNLFIAALVLSIGVEGCQRKPKDLTPILGRTGQVGGGEKPFGAETPGTQLPTDLNPTAKPIDTTAGGIGQSVRFDPTTMNQDRDRFAANTVYFEFDRATIKPGETSKIDEVVKHLQSNPTHGVQIEGHCDERGTEQYNLSLGDRRALAVREYLVTAGIQPDRVFTISYGEARPAVPGHNEAAWSKNRRGVFVLLTPK
jgi:peptidoglycan-associated lipoprotein